MTSRAVRYATATDTIQAAADILATRHDADRYWTGPSGLPVPGNTVADYLDHVTDLLDKDGWTRTYDTTDNPTTTLDGIDDTSSSRAMIRALADTARHLLDNLRGTGPRTLTTAMYEAEDTYDPDTHRVADNCLRLVLETETGQYSCHLAWAQRVGRTHDDIRRLLGDAAAFARAHGPA